MKTGSNARAIAITPDGKTAYVANSDQGSVTPVDTATGTPGPNIRAGFLPIAIAAMPRPCRLH
jgi:YVTN family beta-propeller protein